MKLLAMNHPEPNDEHAALRVALQRDAEAMAEPDFDAALHAATMRRIRALSEPKPVDHGWWLASAGLTAALVILTCRVETTWQAGDLVPRVGQAQTHLSSGPGLAGVPANDPAAFTQRNEPRETGSVFDLGSFAYEHPRYAMLDASLSAQPAAAFPLDAPSGPMRLDCAYPSSANDQAASFFGRFNFNVSN